MVDVVQGDITRMEVDAIVNAANETLLGGGGVDGAIHRAAGPRLKAECAMIGGCPTGSAKLTEGYDLPARFVIHAVGPVWRGGYNGEDHALASCYRTVLRLVEEHRIDSIAFPCVSAGTYGFPLERACGVALSEIFRALDEGSRLRRVSCVCFSERDQMVYQRVLATFGQ